MQNHGFFQNTKVFYTIKKSKTVSSKLVITFGKSFILHLRLMSYLFTSITHTFNTIKDFLFLVLHEKD